METKSTKQQEGDLQLPTSETVLKWMGAVMLVFFAVMLGLFALCEPVLNYFSYSKTSDLNGTLLYGLFYGILVITITAFIAVVVCLCARVEDTSRPLRDKLDGIRPISHQISYDIGALFMTAMLALIAMCYLVALGAFH
jgi:hypothetical protein